MTLWVTLFKIKIKVIKVKGSIHDFSFKNNTKHIGSPMSRENFESSGKVQKFLITRLPAGSLPTGRQAVPTEGGAGRLSPLAVTWGLEFVERQAQPVCSERSRRIRPGSRRVDIS
jgi:hypothetical protein